ncbi:MAG: ABC transporter substrate-binding protein [Oscillospiraceae bacterium]|nr:ABC transporter substrate-binding protein [Oscillospiraceae bacterium]
MKKAVSLLTCAALLLALLCACAAEQKPQGETRIFTDSAGRQVEVPVKIESIVPSGSYAQMILYTICPDKLMGLSDALTKIQKQYIDEKYWDLPVFGKFYGSSGTFNLEEIIKASPDIIIDMGEEKAGIGADMDTIQSKSGIPVVFIKATMDEMADAYDMLGDLLGEQEAAATLSDYVDGVMHMAAEYSAQIPDAERPRVLFSQGEYGTEVNGKNSSHAEILDYLGVINAADMDSILASGGDEVSMEQIITWNPEIVVLAPDSYYNGIFDDPMWAQVDAVKNGKVCEVPIGPYQWLDRPPSVQRVLGLLWLGNLIYPEYYDFDIAEKTQEFYTLFFHYDLSREEAEALLQNASF